MGDLVANTSVHLPKPPKPLKRWQSRYARWLAAQLGQKVTRERQIEMASAFAKRPLTWKTLTNTQRDPRWKELFEAEQDRVSEEVTRRTRQRYVGLLSKGAIVHGMALNRIAQELKTGDDPMSAVRATAPLVTPLLDRGWPKKSEAEVNTNIKITLTTHQSARLDAPEMAIEATEVPYEIVAEEPAA